jgi:predicted RNase H-like HicB family nuclease
MREFIIYEDNDGLWCAECRDLPGYRAKGRTKEEALEKMKSALLMHYPCKCEE